MTTNQQRERERVTGDGASSDRYVLGGGPVGRELARRLRTEGRTVGFIDESADPGAGEVQGDPCDVATLRQAGVGDATTVVIAGGSDRRNLLIAQLVATNFDPQEVVVRVNDPDRTDLLEAAGHEPVCATSALAAAIAEDL